ncbi:Phage head morphogenesis protein [Burkholderia sp. 8Y]|uniref:phage head morphogenesis protein n=1 Tax=Burkholderia sp. 8Y TaxID=2653133 RepID=UPI0012EF11AF|nr:phage minor head protein [Burkholderia sp. 8Y]VXB24655.1 Phage head morphogenesis protein [Burkholderia sp. 8Y]
MLRTQDKKRSRSRASQPQTRRAETQYALKLRKVALQVGELINGFTPGDPSTVPTMTDMLRRYAEALTPWADATAARMLFDVNRRDEAAWQEQAKEMSRALRDELRNAPTGEIMRALLAEQVTLIKSLPLDAAKRVHDLTLKGIEDSTRAKEISKEIQRLGQVAKSRANLIARTEVARTASTLTQARAEHIGSEGYIWRTSNDSDVRHSHREMNGKYVRWDAPPRLSDGTVTHAGQIYNCRCYPEPVIPD